MADNHKIAGKLTATDWHSLRGSLQLGATSELWKTAYHDFLMQRLNTRYLNPIQILKGTAANMGEGFTIVSIQCALIEFLASLRIGKNYRFLQRGEKNGQFEYSKSSEVFCAFLFENSPFNSYVDQDSASNFYEFVRCKLLHEAMTGGGWRILDRPIYTSANHAIDPKQKKVFRSLLQEDIETYLKQYGTELLQSAEIQAAFVRKFDHLAI